jgi:hypothetical protein
VALSVIEAYLGALDFFHTLFPICASEIRSVGTFHFIGAYTLKGTFWALGTSFLVGSYTLKGAFAKTPVV